MSGLLEAQIPTMVALAKGSQSIKIVDNINDVPEGCSTDTVGADIIVNLLIKVSFSLLELCLDGYAET